MKLVIPERGTWNNVTDIEVSVIVTCVVPRLQQMEVSFFDMSKKTRQCITTEIGTKIKIYEGK